VSASTTGQENWAHWPKLRDAATVAWPCLLHGLRIAAAASLALFVAYTLELDNAYWAGGTAAVVCQPGLGASLRKGWYRAIGTVVGAVAIVLLVAAFPQQHIVFLVGLALFTGLCGFVGAMLRNFAGYGAVLAGVTAVVVASDFINDAGQTFHFAVTRASEIIIGILSAELVLIVTNRGTARGRLAVAWADVARAIASGLADTLVAGPDTQVTLGARREMIRRVIALDPIIHEATGEAPDMDRRYRTLQAGAEGMFSAISAWRGIANHFDASWDSAVRDDTATLLPAIALVRDGDWLDDPEAVRQACDAMAQSFQAMPAADTSTRFLVDRMTEALRGLQRAANGLVLVAAPGGEIVDSHATYLRVPDMLPAMINGLRVMLLVLAVAFEWVGTKWSGGQAMLEFAALILLLFSTQTEDVYPYVVEFAIGATISVALAGVVNFVVLPTQHDFLGLSLASACVLVPFGALAAGRWHKSLFAGLVLMFLLVLTPENQQSYDTDKFLNTGLEVIAGAIAAAVAMRLVPPVSPPRRVKRLLALTLRDLRRLAVARRWRSRTDWTILCSQRLAAMPAQAAPVELAQLVAALSAGEAVIDLRDARAELAGRGTLDRALASLAAPNSAGTRHWLARFSTEQALGEAPEALPGMRGRAAAAIIAETLARHGAFFDSTASLVWS
jgi:uncharacterized membrane protein YccC